MMEITKNNKAHTFFFKAYETFLKASEESAVKVFIKIGEHCIKLVFANNVLIPYFLPALKHLECNPEENIKLTIYMWDTLSTGLSISAGKLGDHGFLRHGLIEGYNSKEISTTYNMDSGILNIYNHDSKKGICWVRDPKALPFYEMAAPFRNILSWWGQVHDLQFTHAAVVGTKEDGGVLLVGKGGSGKSTSALLSLYHPNMVYLSDDYLFVGTRDDGTPCAYSIYNSAKLHTDHAKAFPELFKHTVNKNEEANEKRVLFINDFHKNKIQNSIDLKAIVLPKVTGLPQTTYSKTTSSHAFRALVPSSIFQLPEADRTRTFQIFGSLIRALPSYNLYAGTKFSAIPDTLVKILMECMNDK